MNFSFICLYYNQYFNFQLYVDRYKCYVKIKIIKAYIMEVKVNITKISN